MILHQLIDGLLLVAFAVFLFLVAFGVHVAVWRNSKFVPSNSALITVFVAAILVECLLGAVAATLGTVQIPPSSLAVAGVLALQLAACYVMTYPAMQANSPTLNMAHHLSAAGPGGLTPEELYDRMSEQSLVIDRIDDLLKDHLAVEDNGQLRCTASGALLAGVFTSWKNLLGEQKGG